MHEIKRFAVIALCVATAQAAAMSAAAAPAGENTMTYTEAKDKRAEAEEALYGTEEEMALILEKQDELQEEIDEIDAAMVQLLVDIEQTQRDIEEKQIELDAAKAKLAEAQAEEDRQLSEMSLRIQYMYENGSATFLEGLLDGNGIADILSRTTEASAIYDSDRRMLEEYREARAAVEKIEQKIEDEEETLEAYRDDLAEQEERLEAERRDREDRYGDYDERYAEAERLALEYQQTIGDMNDIIADKLDLNTTVFVEGDTSLEKGEEVVAFAEQFIGNPYVWGGESLTRGCDCSGFVKSVYAHFGVSLPHYSGSLRHVGYGVSVSEMQPGDIVCYEGHVGIYAGDDRIVNASNSKPYPAGGIKYSSVYAKKIIAVRRIFR